MSESELDAEDAAVAQMAVDALDAAQKQALESGEPVVLLRGSDLVRIERGVETVIETLPPRKKVEIRIKQARS